MDINTGKTQLNSFGHSNNSVAIVSNVEGSALDEKSFL